ncbi:hypothetical protein [Streptomyces sp. DW26H14]|uniref:hypothetical protein n=1 Tax=Streptomyces sp. DW26H14 TaxID=3435395 RepID=UPI00403D9783
MSARTTAVGAGDTAGPPARAHDTQHITGALFVDSGLDADGKRIRPPRAKYECLLCRTVDGPVHGTADVTAFVPTARNDHRARCTARQENHT